MSRTPIACVLAPVLAAALGIAGCSDLGASSIISGRAQYAEAISRTTDQQTLGMIVRARYGESFEMLAVTSVTANMSVKTNAQVQVGIGPESTFAGNLVPLQGGVVYEENPTITYVPVEGPQYLREYLSPNPLEIVVLVARSAPRPAFVLSILFERLNGLWNPGAPAAKEGDDRFTRALELMDTLRASGELEWAEIEKTEAEKTASYAVVMQMQGGPSPQMKELAELLRIDLNPSASGRIVLPLRQSSLERSRTAIDVATRSVFELLQIAAQGVEVPDEDRASELAIPATEKAENGSPVKVRWSATEPKNASVVVRHGKGWFYIDATDHSSKQAFNLIQSLLVARTRGSLSEGRLAAPVLTVPASK